jgi:hypothetical protein
LEFPALACSTILLNASSPPKKFTSTVPSLSRMRLICALKSLHWNHRVIGSRQRFVMPCQPVRGGGSLLVGTRGEKESQSQQGQRNFFHTLGVTIKFNKLAGSQRIPVRPGIWFTASGFCPRSPE